MKGLRRPFLAVVTAGALFAGLSGPVLAQENPFEGTIPPELVDTFNKAKDSLPNLQGIEIPQKPLGEGVFQLSGEGVVRDIEGSLGGVWTSLGAWTEAKLGINLAEVFITIINFVFFLIKLMVKLLRAVLNLIPF